MSSTWAKSRLYENDFEGSDWLTSWSAASFTRAASTALGGLYAGSFSGAEYATKYLNTVPQMWLRFYLSTAGGSVDDAQVITLDCAFGSVVLSYVAATDTFTLTLDSEVCSVVGGGDFHCWEIGVNADDGELLVYVDGVFMDAVTPAAIDYDATTLLKVAPGTSNCTYILDELAIDRHRIGILPPIGPHVSDFSYDSHVELNGVPFNLTEQGSSYQKRAMSDFNPRLGVGAPSLTDLSGFQHHGITSMQNGLGQPAFSDEFSYLYGDSIDPTSVGLVRLANKITKTDTDFGLTGWSSLADGYICSASNDLFSLFGLAFGHAAPSASYDVLCAYNGSEVQTYAFTCTGGVRDILDNGQYVFVTLCGARMQKSSSASGGISFSEDTGLNSIRFDETDDTNSIIFTPLFTWSNVGSDVNVPNNMGLMAMFDEFLWVAECDAPYLHRAGQVNASDLEGGNPDDDVSYDTTATRIGAGYVPISGLCAYLDYLYVGREDGLYRVSMDADTVYVDMIMQTTRHRDNFRGMAVYNGYLTYCMNGRVYQFNGTSAMDITPGPISNTYPYNRYRRFAHMTGFGSFLFTLGSTNVDEEGTPTWDLLCFTQSGWHNLGTLDAARVNALPAVEITQLASSGATVYLRAAYVTDVEGKLAIYSQRTEHGAWGGYSPVATTGYIETSSLDFGLPLVSRMMSLVRFRVENLIEGVNRVHAYYYPDEGELTYLGTIASADCNFLAFPEDTVVKTISFRWVLETEDEDESPAIRTAVIQYMDRPETVWGYTLLLDLGSPPHTMSSGSVHYNPAELLRLLEGWRDAKVPISMREPSGNTAEVFITDVLESSPYGIGTSRMYTVSVNALGVSQAYFMPPAAA